MNSSDQPFLIVNPQSAGGLTEQEWASCANVIRRNFGPFDCQFTKNIWDAAEIAEQQSKEGRKFLVAVGGDGTISEVANGILRSKMDTELGILPRGTGGDFRRTLNLPNELGKAAEKLRQSTSHRMDVGQVTYVNHQGHEESRFFLNTASFGMSGDVARRINGTTRKWLGGKIAYATATIKSTLNFSGPDVSLQFDDQEPARLRIALVCIANGRFFGGGMKIAPEAKLNDGRLDLIIVKHLPSAELLAKSYRLYAGSHLELDEVAFTLIRKLRASSLQENQAVLMEVDGETPGRLPATFEVLPAALRVRN